ncbi:MAG: FAD:protein FMN transferase [Myxococcales bacterium FL481]|nr:MAG: FAD:protein FMN transferase [Myxococcales bacterium FL481]
MGTTYEVKVGAWPPGVDRTELAQTIAAEVAAVDATMSNYRPDSELSRFNAAGAGTLLRLSEPLFHVLEASQRVARESGGAFDVTISPLVDAYGFGPGTATDDPAERARLRDLVDYQQLELVAPDGVRKAAAGVACTLSAVAKGYAVDRVAERLEARGVANYMVEIGGEVRVAGRRADGSRWRLGIERPAADALAAPRVQRTLEIDAGALATSGDYRNYREVDGRRVSHTLDPRTGAPITHTLASVSLVHRHAMYADAYATALNVLGPDAGMEMAERLGLAALFLVRRGDRFEEKMSSAFTALVEAR